MKNTNIAGLLKSRAATQIQVSKHRQTQPDKDSTNLLLPNDPHDKTAGKLMGAEQESRIALAGAAGPEIVPAPCVTTTPPFGSPPPMNTFSCNQQLSLIGDRYNADKDSINHDNIGYSDGNMCCFEGLATLATAFSSCSSKSNSPGSKDPSIIGSQLQKLPNNNGSSPPSRLFMKRNPSLLGCQRDAQIKLPPPMAIPPQLTSILASVDQSTATGTHIMMHHTIIYNPKENAVAIMHHEYVIILFFILRSDWREGISSIRHSGHHFPGHSCWCSG